MTRFLSYRLKSDRVIIFKSDLSYYLQIRYRRKLELEITSYSANSAFQYASLMNFDQLW
jgi:hypothetical protein